MNGNKLSYVVVGAFVVAMIVGLVVSLTKLSGWTANRDKYFTVFHNVTGIEEGTKVLYEGFAIGRVARVSRLRSDLVSELVGKRAGADRVWFRVDFEIEQGWTIPPNSVAEIVAPGLLAAPTVNIFELAPTAKVAVREYEGIPMIPGRESATISKILQNAGPLVDSLESLLEHADRTLISQVDPLIVDLRDLAQHLNGAVPTIIDRADAFSVTINEIAGELRSLVREENRQLIEDMIRQLNAAAADVTRLTANANGLTERADRLVASVKDMVDDNRQNVDESIKSLRYLMDALARDIDSINRNVEGTARNMYEFSREIRRNPGLLLGGAKPQDTANRRK